MRNNYCLMNVNGRIKANDSTWEVLVLSEDGNLIYSTNVFIEAKNVEEAIEIAEGHIDIHKDIWDKYGSVQLDEGVLIKKKN